MMKHTWVIFVCLGLLVVGLLLLVGYSIGVSSLRSLGPGVIEDPMVSWGRVTTVVHNQHDYVLWLAPGGSGMLHSPCCRKCQGQLVPGYERPSYVSNALDSYHTSPVVDTGVR